MRRPRSARMDMWWRVLACDYMSLPVCACLRCISLCVWPINLLNMESAICYPAETTLLFIDIFQLIIYSPKAWLTLFPPRCWHFFLLLSTFIQVLYLSTQIKYLIARHQNYQSALAAYRFRVFYKNHIKICYIIAIMKEPHCSYDAAQSIHWLFFSW